eukprot:scaffold609_cov170-Amphora_coffeaeformis.AAC.11
MDYNIKWQQQLQNYPTTVDDHNKVERLCTNIKLPTKISRNKRNCERYLKHCRYYGVYMRSQSAKQKQSTLRKHIVWPLTDAELKLVWGNLAEFIINSKLPFRTVDRGSFHQLIDSLCPMASSKLPRHIKLKKLISKLAAIALKGVKERIRAKVVEGHLVGICVDRWQNVSKEHINHSIAFVGGEAFATETIKDKHDHNGIVVACGWEDLINQYASKQHGVAGQDKFYVYLMVGALLKAGVFKNSVDSAIQSTIALNKSSSNVQGCFASLLRVRKACKEFGNRYKNCSKFPESCRAWLQGHFWKDIEEAELLMRPFCDASYLLQQTGNTMAHVMLMMLNLA